MSEADPESVTLTFQVFDGSPSPVSYPFPSIASAQWTTPVGDYVVLVLRLLDGSEHRHKVMRMTAVNVCERVGR